MLGHERSVKSRLHQITPNDIENYKGTDNPYMFKYRALFQVCRMQNAAVCCCNIDQFWLCLVISYFVST